MQSEPWAMMTRRYSAGCAIWVTWNNMLRIDYVSTNFSDVSNRADHDTLVWHYDGDGHLCRSMGCQPLRGAQRAGWESRLGYAVVGAYPRIYRSAALRCIHPVTPGSQWPGALPCPSSGHPVDLPWL